MLWLYFWIEEGYFEYGNFEFEYGNFEKQSGELKIFVQKQGFRI